MKCNYLLSAIEIQKMYKGYYVRKKLNMFYNLPYDLQRKVIWHINENIYLKHFHCSIAKIIYNKYYNFYERDRYNYYIIKNCKKEMFLTKITPEHQNFIDELFHIIKLTIKYLPIINLNKIRFYVINIVKYLLKSGMFRMRNNSELQKNLYTYCDIIIKNY